MTDFRENPHGNVIRECADLDAATNHKLITLQERGLISFHYSTNPSESPSGAYYVFTVHDSKHGDSQYRVKLRDFRGKINAISEALSYVEEE